MGFYDAARHRTRTRVPKMAFDFIDGAAGAEVSSGWNRTAFEELAFRGSVLAGVGERSIATEVLGRRLEVPVITAPTGLSRLSGRGGEVAAAVGAERQGSVAILSATGSAPPEEVARATRTPQWIQLYLYEDPEQAAGKIERAKVLGFETLVVTVDTPVAGLRERDVANRMSVPLRLTPRMVWEGVRKPRWLWDYITGPPLVQSDIVTPAARWRRVVPSTDRSIATAMTGMFNANQTWADLSAIASAWDGKLVVKGVMNADDARRAVDAGAHGIVVSNHGGRQLDGFPSALDALAEVVDAVGTRADVLLDGGVRRGTDVVKAIAIGAKACLVGRPWIYAMSADGADGVSAMLADFAADIDRTLGLLGVRTVQDLGRGHLLRRPGSGWVPFAST